MHRQKPCQAVPVSLRLQSQGKNIREALDLSENLYRKVTAEEIEYEKQESRYRFMLDMNTMKSVAEEKGLAKGLERGRNEGAVNKQHEIAKKMREEGIDLELISRITDLPVETIETLR